MYAELKWSFGRNVEQERSIKEMHLVFVLAQVINNIVCLVRTLISVIGVGLMSTAHLQLLRMFAIGLNFDLTWTCYFIAQMYEAIAVTAYTHFQYVEYLVCQA